MKSQLSGRNLSEILLLWLQIVIQIDFSARPVDPIFRNAREQLDSIREYRDTGSPISNHMAVDLNRRLSPSLKEAESE